MQLIQFVSRRKVLVLVTLVLALIGVCLMTTSVYAADGLRINPSENALTNDVKSIADRIVIFARTIVGVVVAVFVVWGALLLLGATNNPQKMAAAKTRFGIALVALIVVFMADKLVSLAMGLFGFKV